MKSFLGTCLVLAVTASQALATITIVTPWSSTTWNSNGHGNITWTASGADLSQKCDIQLLNGATSNANMVAHITPEASPIACSDLKFDINPLNDFASGKYSIRIGQNSTNTWTYSGLFNFVGKGTANPLQLANGTSSTASSSGLPATSSSSKSNSTSNGSPSGSSPLGSSMSSHKSAAGKLSVGGVVMTVVPAVAAAIAFAA